MYDVWDAESGNRLEGYETKEEAERLIDECVGLGWDRDDLFIDEWD